MKKFYKMWNHAWIKISLSPIIKKLSLNLVFVWREWCGECVWKLPQLASFSYRTGAHQRGLADRMNPYSLEHAPYRRTTPLLQIALQLWYLCRVLLSPSKQTLCGNPLSRLRVKKKWASLLILVRVMGLEPILSRTRPLNVRVCRFRHTRILFIKTNSF